MLYPLLDLLMLGTAAVIHTSFKTTSAVAVVAGTCMSVLVADAVTEHAHHARLSTLDSHCCTVRFDYYTTTTSTHKLRVCCAVLIASSSNCAMHSDQAHICI
jgi:hypothetical protein